MTLAEQLTAVVGVLFVEKYEYTVEGMHYIGAWFGEKAATAGASCGYMPQEDESAGFVQPEQR